MNEDIEIRQIVKFSGDGYGKASVTFRIGSLIVHGARVMEKEGKRWLAMPARSGPSGKWFPSIVIESDEVRWELERQALEAFDSTALVEAEVSKAL